MKNKFLPLFALFILIPFVSLATHIVGGSLTYEHLGGSTYRVTLKLYKDCGAGSAPFNDPIKIEVRRSDGTLFSPDKSITISFPGATKLKPFIDTCAFNPGVCVEEAIYSKIVTNLPPVTGGYHLYYQVCCRNGSIINIDRPLETGESFYAYIPDVTKVSTNSSPMYNNFPPIFICAAQPLIFDHSATDIDGDSLSYSFYTPYQGCQVPCPAPGNPAPPTFPGGVATFTPVVWNSGFSANNPLGGSGLTINPTTGLITGTPPSIGQFVVGVRVREFRNGQRIGETLRDFQFNVLNCPPLAKAGIAPVNGCKGTAINFINTSTANAKTFYWDFGVAGITTDTSYKKNPSYTYPALGTYTVTLITQYGTKCADTAYQTVTVSWVAANFKDVQTYCTGTSVKFTDSSTVAPNSSIVSWLWNFGDGQSSNQQNPSHVYVTPGTYAVKLLTTSAAGCKDSITKNITITPSPVAKAGNDLSACKNNPAVKLSGSVTNTPGGTWKGGAGTYNPNANTLGATYTASAAEIAAGIAKLILITTGNAVCPADTDSIVITYTPAPTVNAGADIVVCKDTSGIPLNGTVTIASAGVWSSTGSGIFSPSADSVKTKYIPSSADTAAGNIKLILTSNGNANCIPVMDTVNVTFTPTPVANIVVANDTSCIGIAIPLSVTGTISSGKWTSSGNGSFSPSPDSLKTSYMPSGSDNAAGKVTFYFSSTNNGGCRPAKDSAVIILVPPPQAAFDINNICSKQVSVFTDQSTPVTGIKSWKWKFGNGDSSTLQNTSYTYLVPGTYTVTLIITGKNGCIDSTRRTIIVYPSPQADFNANPLCFKDSVYFTDLSIISSGSITGWKWEFGDGTSSIKKNPGHLYTTAGFYQVKLVVTSDQGCTDSIAKIINIKPAPFANFIHTSVCFKDTTFFTDKSLFAFGNITTWFWNFGDGTTSSQMNPSHIYNSSGTYQVSLIIGADNGCTDTVVKNVTVYPLPVAAFSYIGSCGNEKTQFTDLSTVSPGTVISWKWDFGDGGQDVVKNPLHQYAGIGSYPVTLIVKSSEGCADTVTGVVTIKSPPKAAFTVDKTPSKAFETVKFTDISTGANGWTWHFGDSDTSIQQHPSHVYTNGGKYTVLLIIRDGLGCSDTAYNEVVITLPPKIPSGFTPNGDGKNDYLKVLGGPYKNLAFNIYNNWGELIFTSNNQSNGWDGTKNGVLQPIGVYVYTLEAVTEDNIKHRLSGDVSLLR